MTWFVDASAIVAILGFEEDWEAVADRLDQEATRLWSPLSRWESTVALSKRLKKSVGEAQAIVVEFAEFNGFQLIEIGPRESELAIDAAICFGKGSGHRAKLNMGDCFAYACAKANEAKLLYKGNDFIHTDLA